MGPDSLPKAIASFKKAIELNHSNYEAFFELGRLYVDVGYLDEGRKNLFQAIELNPRSAWAYGYLGWSYYLSGNLEKAREHYQAAYNITPGLGNMLFVHIQEEEYEQAISQYEEILKLDQDSEWWWHDLAVVYKNAGIYSKSIKTFRNLIESYSGRPWHYIGLSTALTEIGRNEEAAEVYRMAFDSCSECSESLMIHFNASLNYQRMGDTAQAHDILISAYNLKRVKLSAFHNSMEKIVQFYLGNISADSVEQVIVEASQKLQRQNIFLSHYFYLGLAYLYNLKPGYVLTPE